MGAREEVTQLLDIILRSAERVFDRHSDHIPLEFEELILASLLDAYEKGITSAHSKPTIPPKVSAQIRSGPVPPMYNFEGETTPAELPHSQDRKQARRTLRK